MNKDDQKRTITVKFNGTLYENDLGQAFSIFALIREAADIPVAFGDNNRSIIAHPLGEKDATAVLDALKDVDCQAVSYSRVLKVNELPPAKPQTAEFIATARRVTLHIDPSTRETTEKMMQDAKEIMTKLREAMPGLTIAPHGNYDRLTINLHSKRERRGVQSVLPNLFRVTAHYHR